MMPRAMRKSATGIFELLAWYREHGRDLPWRRTRDPYAVLVSEFMAQQTTIAAVVPYFERWMERFPTVVALAAAGESDVLAHWQGLGYYSRARNLHRAAKEIVDRHGGAVPNSIEELQALPGIGAYTAGAVLAFSFDAPAPVVDANVARVLARWTDYRKPIDSSAGREFLDRLAMDLQPANGGSREWNSAVMELGALVCKPRAPLCSKCPIAGSCRTRDPELLPIKRARRRTTEVTERRAFVLHDGLLYLEQSTGRWKGMWILPETASRERAIHVETYSITRFRVRMEVVRAGPNGNLTGFPVGDLERIAIPSPHRRVIRALAGDHAARHREA